MSVTLLITGKYKTERLDLNDADIVAAGGNVVAQCRRCDMGSRLAAPWPSGSPQWDSPGTAEMYVLSFPTRAMLEAWLKSIRPKIKRQALMLIDPNAATGSTPSG